MPYLPRASYSPSVGLSGSCCIFYSDWAGACGSTILATGNSGGGPDLIWRWDFSAGPGFPEQVNTLEGTIPQSRSVDGDDDGHGYTVGVSTTDTRIVFNRWQAGQPGVDADVVIAASGQNPHVRACRADTAYISYFNNATSRIEMQRICFGATCCMPGTCGAIIAPDCNAGAGYSAECSGGTTTIALDGTGSSDPAGLTLNFAWTTDCPGGSFDDPASPSPSLILDTLAPCPLTCNVTLTVDNGSASSSCDASVTVADTQPPIVTSAGTVTACLWPPNHKYVPVPAGDIRPTVTDACGGPVTWTITGCASNQPDNGLGDGNTEDDCLIAPDGQSLMVRAERQGGEPAGRDYAVEVVATDGCGNVSPPSTGAIVHVPHDSRPTRRCDR